MKEEGYSIKDLEVLSGIKAHTIRIWEKRYGLLKPERTFTNIRNYSEHDLRKILNVSLLVNNGYKISKVAEWDENRIRETILLVTENKNGDNDIVERLMFFMLNFDLAGFKNLTDDILMKLGLEKAIYKVFFHLFERIGTFWQVGSVFPAQEHFVTNIIRQKIIAETDKIEPSGIKNASILFFLPENEMHELSLLFYSYLAQKMGYNVIYLGQFVPFEDLVKIQSRMKIDFVFTAFINSIYRIDLEDYLIKLKQLFKTQKVFITGSQIQIHNPGIPRNVKTVKDNSEFKKYFG